MSSSCQTLTPGNKDGQEYELPPVKEPYLPKIDSSKYTLVLDLDETLVHYVESETDPKLLIRPG